MEARQFDQAIQKFESALRLEKSNPEIHALVDRARGAWEQAQRAERLVRDASDALNRGDLSAAHRNAASALSLDPRHPQAGELAKKIRQQMESRERGERLQEGLSHIRRLALVQNFDEAMEALKELRKQYPESAEAAQLLDRVTNDRLALMKKQRLEAGITRAKELLRGQLFEQAMALIAALRAEFLESPELGDLAAYAAEELRSRREADEIARAAGEARTLLQANEFEPAIQRLNSALAAHPNASVLRELLQTAASEQAELRRRTALEETLRQSSSLLASERFGEALERIAAFVRAFGDDPALETARRNAGEGLERQRRIAGIRKSIVDAQTLIDAGRPSTATEVLQQATKLFPGDPELARMLGVAHERLREKQDAETISNLVAEAESLSRATQFDPALERLATGLRQYPANGRLLRCQEAIRAAREAQLLSEQRREALDRAGKLRSEGKLAEAAKSLVVTRTQLANDPALLELKRAIDDVRGVFDDAQARLNQGQIESAVKVLKAGSERYPDEPAITQLMTVAESRFAELQRSREIAQIEDEASLHLKAKRFEQALHVLDTALNRLGAIESLTSLRESVARAQSDHQRAANERIREQERVRERERCNCGDRAQSGGLRRSRSTPAGCQAAG